MSPHGENYADCRFMPLRLLEKAIEPVLRSNTRVSEGISKCKQNIVHLQNKKCGHRRATPYTWASLFGYAVRKAVYRHDWDQLLVLLRASPVWEHNTWGKYHRDGYTDFDLFYKAYIILLTHHPEAKAQNLLQEYLHMVQSCRSDQDKKAIVKVLAMLPDKLISRNSHPFAKGDVLKEDFAKEKYRDNN